jgi:acetylornithine/succinyldiaminopimelate/putrescine aminotransferase
LREHGIGVIHGGANSLRFTPTFGITSAEVDLIVTALKQALLHGPRVAADASKAA